MGEKTVKSRVISSLFWKVLERGGVQGVQFVVQILLARMLTSDDYGVITLITIFINIANVLVQGGFSSALIRKKDTDEKDYSSIFYLCMVLSVILYAFLFFSAPLVAIFYDKPILTNILRVLAITLFFGAYNAIQIAILSKEMEFKKLFYSSLGAVFVSGVVGVYMAYAGFGPWALVGQQLTNQVMISVILTLSVEWRPKLIFSFQRVKDIFSFSSKLLVSNLINTIYTEVNSLVVGKKYTMSTLGYYSRGKQFPAVISSNIDTSIQAVMFPAFSMYSEEPQRLKEMVRRSIKTSSFVMFPVMIGLAAVSEEVVLLFLTDKWIDCVPFLQVFCFAFMLYPIHSANLQAINALGRSDVFLKLEIIKKILGITILLIALTINPFAIAVGELLCGLIATFVNAYPNKRLLCYSFREQLVDIAPPLVLSILMFIGIKVINLIGFGVVLSLLVKVIFGMLIYISLSYIFKIESFVYILNSIKEIRKR